MSTRTEEIKKNLDRFVKISEPFLEILRVLNSNVENSRRASDYNFKCDVNEIISTDVQCMVKELKNNIDKLDTNIDTIREVCDVTIRFPRGRASQPDDSGLAQSLPSTFDSLAVQVSETPLPEREGSQHEEGDNSKATKQ